MMPTAYEGFNPNHVPKEGNKVFIDPKKRFYQLKFTLRDIRPPIWRRIVISGRATLNQLHHVIQAIMPWQDKHPHRFMDSFSDNSGVLESTTISEELLEIEKFITYDYDPKAVWEHRIVVEHVFDHNPNPFGAFCYVTGGERAVPPEDCGGVDGYVNLLNALNNPKHPKHADLAEWMTNKKGYKLPFDAGYFNVEAANDALPNFK